MTKKTAKKKTPKKPRPIRYATACSGINAARVALAGMNWTEAWASEIEPFARAVLAHHYPRTPNLGDLLEITSEQLDSLGPIDVLVGGTPCQSFSVAGLRGGMDDPRGNLALGFLALLARTRAPWVVWENVPGVLSSHTRQPDRTYPLGPFEYVVEESPDFACFTAALAELGYGWAYRTLDAQYVRVDTHPRAVPQRRRRVFVVGHLGGWPGPAAVLFDRDSLRGHPPPRRQPQTGAARTLTASTGGASGKEQQHTFIDAATQRPLNALDGAAHCVTGAAENGGTPPGRGNGDTYIGEPVPIHNTDIGTLDRDRARDAIAFQCHGGNVGPPGTLRATANETRGVPCVADTLTAAYARNGGIPGGNETQPRNIIAQAPVAHTLRSKGYDASEDGTGPGPPLVIHGRARGDDGRGYARPPQVTELPGALDTVKPPRVWAPPMAVRRLTPRECERLQGLPDDYTLIPYKGRPADRCPDSPRYKAVGNAMAVNVMRWILHRVQTVRDILADQTKTK